VSASKIHTDREEIYMNFLAPLAAVSRRQSLAISVDPDSRFVNDEQSAGQMRPLADEAYRYRYVIMPMRI